jgi:hypothetical protein
MAYGFHGRCTRDVLVHYKERLDKLHTVNSSEEVMDGRNKLVLIGLVLNIRFFFIQYVPSITREGTSLSYEHETLASS